MNLTIRPFEGKADYEKMEHIERDVWPDEFETAEEIMHTDKANNDHFYVRLLAEVNGTPVGWATTGYGHYWSEPNRYTMNGSVLSSYQKQGVGSALYDALEKIWATKEVGALITWLREDDATSIRFAEKRRFVQTLRDARSELDVTTFEREKFAWALRKSAENGIKLHSLSELKAIDPDWKHKTWALRWPIRQDIPTFEPLTQLPYETWQSSQLESPTFNYDGYIVAVAPNGDYVGYSFIEMALGDPTKLYTAVTGVLRDWRRKGIATALKVRVIDFAKQYGATRIETDNEENNPMYDLNMQLGFKPLPAWLTFKKVVNDGQD